MSSSTNVDEAWSLWKYNFTAECYKHAPLIDKKVRGRYCPWLTLEIKQIMRARDASLKKYRRSKLDTDLATYRLLRNKVNARLKLSEENYSRSLLEENSGDSGSFWRSVNKILPDAKLKSIPTCIKAEVKIITDKQSISELFNSFFTSVVNKLFESFRYARPVFKSTTEELFTKKHSEFTAVGKPFVLKQLKCLKLKNATGIDGLPARLFKDSAVVIADRVTHLVNLSIKSGTVPSEWKQAKVVPLFNSGNKDDLDNYRPISILPILSKILEKAVFHQLHSYRSKNSLLSPYQSGFRASHSTQLAITFLIDKIRGRMDKGLLTGAMFIDLKKAFDTVPHDGLLNKLFRYGVQDQPLSWFESYLTNGTQSVSIENHLSSAANISSGVPQGSVLRPLLFIIYINYLPLAVGLSSVMLYADDTVIFSAA